jgi:metalloendopeptidase OMA1, mitochondrial
VENPQPGTVDLGVGKPYLTSRVISGFTIDNFDDGANTASSKLHKQLIIQISLSMKKTEMLKGLGLALLFALSVVACYKNSQTGRSELMLISPAEEAQLGFDTFATMKKETPASQDPAQTNLVDQVGRRISSVVSLPNAQWEFVTFKDDKTANAFCLPGGKIGVYTGILPITLDESGLATVLGHEVSHAVARHGGERMSQALLVQLGGIGLAVALRDKPAQTQQLAMTAYGVGATVGYELPFSRKAESEADYMGLMTMARAGYDPRQALTFWQRFKAYSDQQGGQPPEFLSTHPLTSTRIKDLQKHLPEALAVYQGKK